MLGTTVGREFCAVCLIGTCFRSVSLVDSFEVVLIESNTF